MHSLSLCHCASECPGHSPHSTWSGQDHYIGVVGSHFHSECSVSPSVSTVVGCFSGGIMDIVSLVSSLPQSHLSSPFSPQTRTHPYTLSILCLSLCLSKGFLSCVQIVSHNWDACVEHCSGIQIHGSPSTGITSSVSPFDPPSVSLSSSFLSQPLLLSLFLLRLMELMIVR